ncbi:MAG TPA: sulfotransferase [Niabella sp.]|nr:sulfotransferase [Niabella sp.]
METAMPICIIGMHRSGTSMVTRLLNLCGVYLGAETDLDRKSPDNPEGYWENLNFLQISDKILSSFDGAWDLPPEFPSNWTSSGKLKIINHQADELIKTFGEKEPWGWKDPRTSLTLPFWQSLIPNLKILIVVRNPLDVSRSLGQRGYSSVRFNARLINTYLENIIANTETHSQVLITHYDVFFQKPEDELQRITEFLELGTKLDKINRACEFIDKNLKHNSASLSNLVYSEMPWELIENYLFLCQQAGPHYYPLFVDEVQEFPSVNPSIHAPNYWPVLLRKAKISFEKKSAANYTNSEIKIIELRDIIAQKELEIVQLKENISQLEVLNDKIDNALKKKENHIIALFNRIVQQEKLIENIRQTPPSYKNRLQQNNILKKFIRYIIKPGSFLEKAIYWIISKFR